MCYYTYSDDPEAVIQNSNPQNDSVLLYDEVSGELRPLEEGRLIVKDPVLFCMCMCELKTLKMQARSFGLSVFHICDKDWIHFCFNTTYKPRSYALIMCTCTISHVIWMALILNSTQWLDVK